MKTNAEKNKKQFNRQAQIFKEWSGTKKREYMESLCSFIGLSKKDQLLDVACGSGNFTIFTSQKVKSATGIDISDKQIEIANRQVTELGIKNTIFICHKGENLPFEDNLFSIVITKSAFHHFSNYEKIFDEMVRCCKPGGFICIDDITTYDEPMATSIIDKMDKLMDVSHNRRLSVDELKTQFLRKKIRVVKTKINQFELAIKEYQKHALQTKANLKKIKLLINKALVSGKINKCLFKKGNEVYFINRGYTILGVK